MDVRSFRILPVVLLALASSACSTATSQTATKEAPVTAPQFEGTREIALTKIVAKMPRYEPVGFFATGMFCQYTVDYSLDNDRFELDLDPLHEVFKGEFERVNYKVVGDPGKLFGDPDLDDADYFIAGIVNDLEVNICFPSTMFNKPGDSKADVYLEVEWQVYDTFRQELVYEVETRGSAATEVSRSGAERALDQAFSVAVQNLLAQPDFHRLMSDAAAPAPVVDTSSREVFARDLRASDGTGLNNEPLTGAVAVLKSATGHGTGFLIAPGILLTNAHVVGGAETVKVRFVDGAAHNGKIIRKNTYRDTALVAIDDTSRRHLAMATYSPDTGQEVYSYGAPLDQGFSGTLRRGIVSTHRVMGGQEYLQSDAPVNPGNSGGPLLDEAGNVVAVSVSGILLGQERASNQGINFFIPIDSAPISLDIGWPSS